MKLGATNRTLERGVTTQKTAASYAERIDKAYYPGEGFTGIESPEQIIQQAMNQARRQALEDAKSLCQASEIDCSGAIQALIDKEETK